MTFHRKANVALFTALVALLVGAQQLDGFDDAKHEHAQALAMRDAIKSEEAQQRFQRTAMKLCGSENAVVKFIDSKTVQCLTKHGKKQQKVSL